MLPVTILAVLLLNDVDAATAAPQKGGSQKVGGGGSNRQFNNQRASRMKGARMNNVNGGSGYPGQGRPSWLGPSGPSVPPGPYQGSMASDFFSPAGRPAPPMQQNQMWGPSLVGSPPAQVVPIAPPIPLGIPVQAPSSSISVSTPTSSTSTTSTQPPVIATTSTSSWSSVGSTSTTSFSSTWISSTPSPIVILPGFVVTPTSIVSGTSTSSAPTASYTAPPVGTLVPISNNVNTTVTAVFNVTYTTGGGLTNLSPTSSTTPDSRSPAPAAPMMNPNSAQGISLPFWWNHFLFGVLVVYCL